MPGFIGIIKNENCQFEKYDIKISSLKKLSEENIYFKKAWIKRFFVSKFNNDKIFKDDNDIFICTDGVILNAKDLRNRYVVSNNFELIEKMYKKNGPSFVNELRGPFSGVIYNKKRDTWHIFTDHLSLKPIFYFWDNLGKCLIFGSEFKVIIEMMHLLGYKPKLSELGSYFLLTFGYMLGDYTLAEEIKKLQPGSILTFNNGTINIVQYYKLTSNPYNLDSEEKTISILDERFKIAIRQEYEKDLEFNYKHIATLSGGLDSRMNITYAKKLKYKDLLCITFSQSDYLDEKIAKKIASDFNYEFLFHSLDNGNYLMDIEKPLLANSGLILYSGAAHLLSTISLIDWTDFGLLHSGQMGDPFLGSYLLKPSHSKLSLDMIKKIGYSTKLIDKIPSSTLDNLANEYELDEMFGFYNRGMNGIFNGDLMAQCFSESISPFLYIDFLDYVVKIDPRYRYNKQIYLKWIIKFAPEIIKYPWEKTKAKITANSFEVFSKRVYRYIRRKAFGPSPKDSMNPFEYWYNSNSNLRNFISDYFENHIDLLMNHSSLKKDVEFLFNKGNFSEKTQVLTLLAAMKMHNI